MGFDRCSDLIPFSSSRCILKTAVRSLLRGLLLKSVYVPFPLTNVSSRKLTGLLLVGQKKDWKKRAHKKMCWALGDVRGSPLDTASLPTKAQLSIDTAPETIQLYIDSLLEKISSDPLITITDQLYLCATVSSERSRVQTLQQVATTLVSAAVEEGIEHPEGDSAELFARLSANLQESLVAAMEGARRESRPKFSALLSHTCREIYDTLLEEEMAIADDVPSYSFVEGLSGMIFGVGRKRRSCARRIALTRLMGELAGLEMADWNLVFEAVKFHLFGLEAPEEKDVEAVCRLLATAGSKLAISRRKELLGIALPLLRLFLEELLTTRSS